MPTFILKTTKTHIMKKFKLLLIGITTLLFIACKKDSNQTNFSLSKEILSETITTDVTPPSAPILRIDSANEITQKVYLRWTKSTDDVGVVGYKVYIRYANSTTWYERYTVADTFFTYSNLGLNEYYDFYVAAYDAVGNITASNVVRQPQLFFPPTISCNLTGRVKNVTYTLNWVTTVTPTYFTVKYSQVQYYQGGVWSSIYTQYGPSLTGTYSIVLAKKMEVPWRILIMTDYLDWNLSNVVILKS